MQGVEHAGAGGFGDGGSRVAGDGVELDYIDPVPVVGELTAGSG